MELDYAIIGTKIRELRKAKGWTQEYLAERSGTEPSNISHIERAATKLSLPTLIGIANALEASLDEIVYSNLIKSEHISVAKINELLADCSAEELQGLAEILKAAKAVLRKQK